MFVYDSACQRLELGAMLFEGGEGVICSLSAWPGRLAKLYRPEKRSGKESKLAWMVANPPADPGRAIDQATIAWPETLLYTGSGDFVGYLMPHITNTSTLLHVINPRLRAQTLPGFDQRYLHRTARNLAAALDAVHSQDYLIGDLNETNVLVSPTALVSVIDVDSFQVKEKRLGQITFYPCPVGRPEYTPPELQARRFVDELRQPEQDTFALAVLIFQLLMDGSHPFRSVWFGPGNPPPVEQKIVQGWFPYAAEPRGLVRPPPGLSLERLHPALAGLMLRCFYDGHAHPRVRPSAAEWKNTLEEVEKTLVTCACGAIHSAGRERCWNCAAKSPQALVNCPVCAAANLDRRVYCLKCAARLHPWAACPHCGQLTAQGVQAKYCESCGRRL